jgi:formate/nitrite transporter FocA (FNT family)
MFEIQPQNPEMYRRQTRRSTFIIAGIFLALAMLLSTTAVSLFGEPGGDNLRFNVGGVFVAVLLMVALMRSTFWNQSWMAPAVYGWQLKRSLMSITNVMHQVTAAVEKGDSGAMKLLRFYHLGLSQMHELDGNSSDHSQLMREMDQHKARMEALGIETEQRRLNPAWLEALKQTPR